MKSPTSRKQATYVLDPSWAANSLRRQAIRKVNIGINVTPLPPAQTARASPASTPGKWGLRIGRLREHLAGVWRENFRAGLRLEQRRSWPGQRTTIK